MKPRLLVLSFLICATTYCRAQSSTWYWAVEGDTVSQNSSSAIYRGDCEGDAVATDVNNNAFLSGTFRDSIRIGNFLLITMPNEGWAHAFIAKFDTSGNVLWAQQSLGEVHGQPSTLSYSIVTDKQGNVYSTGTFNGMASFGSASLQNPFYTQAMFLVKYDPNGNVLWARQNTQLTTKDNCYGIGAATDKSGNVYVAGPVVDTVIFGTDTLNSAGNNFFVVKYDANGNLIWAKQANGKSYLDEPNFGVSAITTDRFNAIYIAGEFMDTMIMGADTLMATNSTAYIAKYDSNGNALWGKQAVYNPSGELAASSMAVSNDGSIYQTGSCIDTITFGRATITGSPYGTSFYVLKFDSSGNTIWGKSSGGAQNSFTQGWSVATDTNQHIYVGVSGNYYSFGFRSLDSIEFDSSIFTVVNDSGIEGNSFVLKLDTAGNVLCSSYIAGGGDDENGFAATPSGKYIYLGGDLFTAIKIGPDSLPYKNAEVPFIARWEPCPLCNLAVTVSPQTTTVCNGQSVLLLVGGAANYLWSPASGLNTTTGDSVVANPSVTTTYSISASTGGCLAKDSIVVDVNPAPPLIIQPDPPPFICSGISQSDTMSIASQGSDFTWTPAEGLNTTTGIIVIANPSVSVTYTVTGIDSVGCTATGTDAVTVSQITNRPTFTQNNDTLVSSAKNDNQWYRNDTLLTNDTSQTLIISVLGNYYDVVNNEANGCSTSSDTVPITSLTGINQLTVESGQLTVYPNPSSDFIYVSLSQQQNQFVQLSLYNMLGQEVYTTTLAPSHTNSNSTATISVASLADGVYVLKMNEGDVTQQKEIVVAR